LSALEPSTPMISEGGSGNACTAGHVGSAARPSVAASPCGFARLDNGAVHLSGQV
jgi:hypothetical protein